MRLSAIYKHASGARMARERALAAWDHHHSIVSGMFMMMRRNSLNTIGLSGLVKKSAVLFAVRTRVAR
jgi:hypothetical protein